MQLAQGHCREACWGWICRHGLFVAALWIVTAFVGSQLFPAFVIVSLVLAVALGTWLGRLWLGGVWSICILLSMGIGQWRVKSDQASAASLLQMAPQMMEGVTVADARGDETFWQVPVKLEGETRAKVWWQGYGELPVEGSRVEARGRFELPQAARNPGEFDRQRWMAQQRLLASFRQDPHRKATVRTPQWAQRLAGARTWVRSAITQGVDESAAGSKVIRAVVLGEKPRDDEELLEDFRLSGSMHVFSVSGLHVGMVAILVWLVAAYSGLSRRWLALPVIALVFAYAWLTGANPPAVRAAWMAAVFLGAFCFRRRPDLANALGAVLLVLLIWDVRQLQQPGVQLSYGVVTAIAFGLPWTTRCFSKLAAAPLHMPVAEIKGLRKIWWRLRQWLATTLAVSTAASIGAAPLTAWHFGLVTPVSVIAALLMLPLVFLVMAAALISVIMSPLPMDPVVSSINRGNAWLASRCAQVAGAMAEVPAGHWRLGQEEGPLLLVYDLKYGDGAACLVPESGAEAVLIDCGGSHSFKYPLRASLQRLGIEPDSVVLSHPDGGHVGGGHAVWRELPIRQALMPVRHARSPAYRHWLEEAPLDGVRLIEASAVNGLPLGERARLEWLHVPDADNQNLAADQRVLVMRLHWQGWKVLWLGDAGASAEAAMLASGRDLTADVVIAGNHRGGLSLGERFLEAVNPRMIISGGDQDVDVRPHLDQAIAHWRSNGIVVFDQSKCGAVSLRPDERNLRIESHVDGRRIEIQR